MSQLFGKGTIKSHIEVLAGFDDSKIEIIKRLHQDRKNKLLDDESRYEQTFNQIFFGDLLDYEDRINRIPKGGILGSGIADLTIGDFADGKYEPENVQVVCELKGAKSNLSKKQFGHGGLSPVGQGFAYKTGLKNCKRLIVSNFYEIRLYRDNTTDFEIRNLDELLDPKDNYFNLRKLYLLLHKDNLLTGKTEKLLSHFREEQQKITKKFYQEYKELRIRLIQDIRKNNPNLSVTTSVEKAQKIIDRLIFIFFCEDKGLLPDKKLKEGIVRAGEFDISPREMTKKFFTGVDSGSEKLGIPDGYNGGLFKEDSILNSLRISDDICNDFVGLTNYNFDDDISVNILGHIFEQSISDLEGIKEDLIGRETQDNSKGRRKKDGIFYTPEYIVDYIVQNSVMRYLNEKEDECLTKYKNKKNGEISAYQEYQQILQNIKVLDPACGSGAFLVRVFDVLLEENKRVGSILNSLFDEAETYKNILTNNIYGVDLNEESVEITKLSLRLKSAQKGKKLNNLDSNIKCGNSLIDDPAVAGDKAFDWNIQFPKIFHREEIKTWMITRATHNTRISERMVEFGVQLGEPVIMDENDEIEITKYISEIVQEDMSKQNGNDPLYKILAYNICRDHIHMILQCTESERDDIVQKFKSVSSRKYNINHGLTIPLTKDNTDTTSKGSGPLVHTAVGKGKNNEQNHFRGQKYNHAEIKDEKYFFNAMEYVQNNREHHDLSPLSTNKSLGSLVQAIVSDKYIFDKIQYKYSGGFDVIVGNPPYVNIIQISKTDLEFLSEKYISAKYGRYDLYVVFIEKSFSLLKHGGNLSFIIPDKVCYQKYATNLRELLIKRGYIREVFDCSSIKIFEQAVVDNVILSVENKKNEGKTTLKQSRRSFFDIVENIINQEVFLKIDNYMFRTTFTPRILSLVNKIEKKSLLLSDICYISFGMQPGDLSKFVFNKVENPEKLELNKESQKKFVRGRNLERYYLNYTEDVLFYLPNELHRPAFPELFENKKIMISEISKNINAVIDVNDFYGNEKTVEVLQREYLENIDKKILKGRGIEINDTKLKISRNFKIETILCILNSKVIDFYFKNMISDGLNVYPDNIRKLPIKEIPLSEQQPFIERTDKMLSLNKEFHELTDKFFHRIQDNLKIQKVTKKLESFYEGEFKDFLDELKKQKISLSLSEQDEWEPYFKEYKEKILSLKGEIERTDKEIDDMVFDLYGLSEDERSVVLGG